MKVLFFSNVMGVGGTDRQIKYIAHELDRRGHTVKILSLRPLRDMGERASAEGLMVSSVGVTGKRSIPSSIVQLIQEIRDFNPDVLSCFLFHANMIGRILGNALRVPVIITSIRNENIGGRFREPITRATNRFDDAVVTNSSTVGKSLIERGVFSQSHHQTIHNCIDTEQFSPTTDDPSVVREELGVSDSEFLWITVGRLNDQKDHKNLLQAISEIKESNIRVAIVGDGMHRERLESMARAENIEAEVLFLGERDDVPRLLVGADAFVLPSRWEGLPNVVMEALACGLPVVSTRVGGVSELIVDGTGIIVEKNDSEELAHAMKKLMSLSDNELSNMGKNGRDHILENFSINSVVDQWIKLYKECGA